MSAQQARALVLIGLILTVSLAIWLFSPRSTASIDSYTACATAGYPVSDTFPTTCNDGVHTFVGPAASPSPSAAPVTALQYEVLVDGDSLGTYPKSQLVITSHTQWVQYWNAVHAGLPTIPPILPVDFTSSQVVAMNEGPEPTDGYSLAVTSVATSASGTIVNLIRTVPVPACHAAHKNSNEYLLVQTPKLTTPVSFDITTQPRRC